MTRTGSASGPCSLSLRTASRAAVSVLIGPFGATWMMAALAASDNDRRRRHTTRTAAHSTISWREVPLVDPASQRQGLRRSSLSSLVSPG